MTGKERLLIYFSNNDIDSAVSFVSSISDSTRLLCELFVEYYDDSHTVVSILELLSHLELSPELVVVAIAAVASRDSEVQDYGLGLLRGRLGILRSIRCEGWLLSYLDRLIEEEGHET